MLRPVIINTDIMINLLMEYLQETSYKIESIRIREKENQLKINLLIEKTNQNRIYALSLMKELTMLSEYGYIDEIKFSDNESLLSIKSNGITQITEDIFDKHSIIISGVVWNTVR